jgi:intermediate peptidase
MLQCCDEISDVLCRLLDPAMLCANVHPSDEHRAAAFDVVSRLSGVMHELNIDRALFACLKERIALPSDDDLRTLSDSDWRLARAMLHEFDRNGIELDDAQRRELLELNEQITELGIAINEADMQSEPSFDASSLSSMPSAADVVSGGDAAQRDESLRRRTYMERLCSDSNRRRVELFESLLACRHKLAQRLSADTYANYVARSPRVAGSTADVERFLLRISAALRPRALRELEQLRDLKRRLLNESSSNSNNNDDDNKQQQSSTSSVVVEAWDMAYLRDVAAKQTSPQTSPLLELDELVSDYFSLQNCIDGLDLVSQRLFGIRLQVPHNDDVRFFGVLIGWFVRSFVG